MIIDSERRSASFGILILGLSSLLFLFTPIFRGGNRQISISIQLGLGLFLAVVLIFYRKGFVAPLPGRRGSELGHKIGFLAVYFVALCPLWIGCLQLIPVDLALAQLLSDQYDAFLFVGRQFGTTTPLITISQHPSATYTAIFSAFPACMLFFASYFLDWKNLERLLYVVILSGVVQAIIAILQFFLGGGSFLYFGSLEQGFIGTFANRNHLAGYLAALLPFMFYLFFFYRDSVTFSSFGVPLTLIKGAVAILFLLFLVVILGSLSRGGIAAALFSTVSSSLICFSRKARIRRGQAQLLIGGVFLLLVFSFFVINTEALISRVTASQIASDASVRQSYAEATRDGINAFFPLGSGIGSFSAVFPRFQYLSSRGYVDYAHNDYLQFVMEGGILALIPMGILLILFFGQAGRVIAILTSSDSAPRWLFIQAFAGVSACTVCLQSIVEFNFHIPALALAVAFYFGTFMRRLETHSDDMRVI